MPDKTFEDLRPGIDLITFDCYGTLIDWEKGLRAAIADATGSDDPRIFDAYVTAEARVESGPYLPYREIQALALQSVANDLGLTIPAAKRHILSETLPDWPLWPDTNDALARLKKHFRLGILSNIDRDLFARTAARFSVDFDLLITAQDVRSYKPAPAHFERMLDAAGGNRTKILHAAQSLYHDCVPATKLGIPNVWINRRLESNDTPARPLATLNSIQELADALLAPQGQSDP